MLDVLTPPFDFHRILSHKRAIRKQLLARQDLLERRIAVVSGSTIGEIKSLLELFLLNQGIRPVFYEGLYGSYYEDLTFGSPELDAFEPDVIVIHTSFRNLTDFPVPGMDAGDRERLLETSFERWQSMWEVAADRYGCVLIQNNFEMPPERIMGNLDAVHPDGKLNFIQELNGLFYDYQRQTPRFLINDIHYLSALAGLDRWHDLRSWYLYRYALAPDCIPLLCHSLASIIKAVYGYNKKALILDLDHTLWGGVIGDDGVSGIQLGKETPEGMAYLDFQRYVKALTGVGILLGVCSKNEEASALEGLAHPASVLRQEDFVSFKANWTPKHENLEETARDLNLGLDSFVFADDNPAERQIVEGFLPQVETIPLSRSEPEDFVRLLDRRGFFELISLSGDDINRQAAYRDNLQRETARASFTDYDDYLRSLEMICRIDRVHPDNLERVTRLINKTNQFNLTTLRLNEGEVERRAGSPDYLMRCASLEDRFGDNGIVLVLSARLDGEVAELELFLMSCRVFKRGLEEAVLHETLLCLQQAGIRQVRGYYFPTAKNDLVKDFYTQQGFVRKDEGVFDLNLDQLPVWDPSVMEIISYDT